MNWRTLMKGGETAENLPNILKITPNRPHERGFEDIENIEEGVEPPARSCLPASQIVPGAKVFYETGPCTVKLVDEDWNMVQVDENGKLVWILRDLITRVG